MSSEDLPRTPEGKLIRSARNRAVPKVSIPCAAARIGIRGMGRTTLLSVAAALVVAVRVAPAGEGRLIAVHGRKLALPANHARERGAEQQLGRARGG